VREETETKHSRHRLVFLDPSHVETDSFKNAVKEPTTATDHYLFLKLGNSQEETIFNTFLDVSFKLHTFNTFSD
jgi:hypothetical protein